MDRLQWDERFSIGSPALDRDHQRMFDTVNGLIDGIGHGIRGVGLHELLDLFLIDIVAHFEREEAVMEQVSFPEAAEHGVEHYELLRTVLHFKGDLKFDRLDANRAAVFLVDWLQSHLVEQDMKLKPYLAHRKWK